MKTFEERRAEIFRRSKERIRKRTRVRRTAIGACATLAVCVTVFSVAVLPDFMTKYKVAPENSAADMNNASEGNELAVLESETSANNNTEDSAAKNESASLVSRYKLTEITSSDGSVTSYRRIEDADNIVQLWQMIDDCRALASQTSSDHRGDDEATDSAGPEAKTEYLYTVVFTTHEGGTEVYTLIGNTLTDKNGETFVLADAELSALTAALDGEE